MRSCLPLILSVTLLSACGGGSGDTGGKTEEVEPVKKKKKKKKKDTNLNRFDSQWTNNPSNRKTGKKLPSQRGIPLIGSDGKPVWLSSYRGKPLVLVVMRGFAGFICPFCSTQTAQLASRYDEITAAGAEVVIVYPTKTNDPAKIDEFVAACEKILAEEGAGALPFKVLLDRGVKLVKKYNLEGIDLSRPSTFVLDARGVVGYAYVGKQVYDRPTVDRILKEIRALGNP